MDFYILAMISRERLALIVILLPFLLAAFIAGVYGKPSNVLPFRPKD